VRTARRFLAEHLPDAHLAIVAGSVVRGEGTPTSDLDIVAVADRHEAPFRASYRFEGVPIELFVHTDASLPEWIQRDAARGRPSLAMMLAEGTIVRGGGEAQALQEAARAVIAAGPAPLEPAALEDARYRLTDLLDDFRGSTRRDESNLIAAALAEQAATLLLQTRRRWWGEHKWTVRALRRADPDAARRLALALDAWYRQDEKEGLIAVVSGALEEAGGELFDGYYRSAAKETVRGSDTSLEQGTP